MKCIDQIAPPPIDSAAAASQPKRRATARWRARCALCNPVKDPNTEMTKDNATKVGSNDVTLVAPTSPASRPSNRENCPRHQSPYFVGRFSGPDAPDDQTIRTQNAATQVRMVPSTMRIRILPGGGSLRKSRERSTFIELETRVLARRSKSARRNGAPEPRAHNFGFMAGKRLRSTDRAAAGFSCFRAASPTTERRT